MTTEARIPELENTGTPAIAWTTALRKEKVPCLWCEKGVLKLSDGPITCPACNGSTKRTILKADFNDVHPQIADLIDQGRFAKCSSEVYDDPKFAGLKTAAGRGAMLRRVAFLGGELPQIKSLADLPKPSGPNRDLKGVEIFATGKHRDKEYTEKNLDEMVQNFRDFSQGEQPLVKSPAVIGHEEEQPLSRFDEGRRKANLHPALILADIRRLKSEGCFEVFAERRFAEDASVSMLTAPKETRMSPEEKDAALKRMAEAGIDTEKLKGVPDDHLKAMAEACPQKMAESDEDKKKREAAEAAKMADDAKKKEDAEAAKYSERFTKLQADLLVENKKLIEAAVAQINKDLGGTKAQVDQFAENIRKANIDTFCEQMLEQGRVAPWELDKSDPKRKHLTIDEQLMTADGKTVVRKYTENGQEIGLTQFDLLVNTIKARKPQKFSEKVKVGKDGKPAAADADADEVAEIEQHYESFSEMFPANTKAEDLVKGFKAARKHDPKLTAKEYLMV